MEGTSGNGWVFRKHGLSMKGSLLWRTSCISERMCLPSLSTVPTKLPFVFGSGFLFLPTHSFPSFPITSSLFDLVNISSHDLTSPPRPHSVLVCTHRGRGSYFSFIMVILRFSALLSPPTSCWNITFVDEMSRFLTDLNANLISPSPFCPTCAALVSIYWSEEWGFVCLTNFQRKSISPPSFSDMQMGQGNLGLTNSVLCLYFPVLSFFRAHLNISGNHLWLFKHV